MLSLIPVEGTPIEYLWDKPIHLVGWAGLYISLQLAFGLKARLAVSAPLLLGYSIVIEVLQAQVGRTFSLLDIVANSCGIVLACIAIVLLKRCLLSRTVKQNS